MSLSSTRISSETAWYIHLPLGFLYKLHDIYIFHWDFFRNCMIYTSSTRISSETARYIHLPLGFLQKLYRLIQLPLGFLQKLLELIKYSSSTRISSVSMAPRMLTFPSKVNPGFLAKQLPKSGKRAISKGALIERRRRRRRRRRRSFSWLILF